MRCISQLNLCNQQHNAQLPNKAPCAHLPLPLLLTLHYNYTISKQDCRHYPTSLTLTVLRCTKKLISAAVSKLSNLGDLNPKLLPRSLDPRTGSRSDTLCRRLRCVPLCERVQGGAHTAQTSNPR